MRGSCWQIPDELVRIRDYWGSHWYRNKRSSKVMFVSGKNHRVHGASIVVGGLGAVALRRVHEAVGGVSNRRTKLI